MPVIPKLAGVEALGLSEVNGNQGSMRIEPEPVQPPQAKLSFKIPKLQIQGLGLSDLVQDPPASDQSQVVIPPVSQVALQAPVQDLPQ